MKLTKPESERFRAFVTSHIDDLNINDGDKLYLFRHLITMLDKYIDYTSENIPINDKVTNLQDAYAQAFKSTPHGSAQSSKPSTFEIKDNKVGVPSSSGITLYTLEMSRKTEDPDGWSTSRSTFTSESLADMLLSETVPTAEEILSETVPTVEEIEAELTALPVTPSNHLAGLKELGSLLDYEDIIEWCEHYIGTCKTGHLFTAHHLREAMRREGYNLEGTANVWGSVMSKLAKLNLVRYSHDDNSPDPSAKGRKVKMWRVL